MTSSICNAEGLLTIQLGMESGRVATVVVRSTRPLGVARVFLGKPVAEVLTTLPLLYSVCATAQAATAAMAAEAALGIRPSEPQRHAREALVLAETAREHLVRCLLGWSTWLGEQPDPRALTQTGRLRAALASALYPEGNGFQPGGGRLAPDLTRLAEVVGALEQILAETVFGTASKNWLKISDADELAAWADNGCSLGARALSRLTTLGWSDLAASVVPPLEQTSEEALEHRLTGPDRDAFIAQPTWDGQPHETGALPREVHRPLIADLTRRHGNGLMTRLAARLSELARLPARIAAALNGLDPDLAPPLAMPKGTSAGIGQIEAARGRLIHRIEIDSGQVVGYQILAPTEWNFHPDGVLVRGLQGLPAGTELHTLVALAIEAVDPCVGYRIQTSS